MAVPIGIGVIVKRASGLVVDEKIIGIVRVMIGGGGGDPQHSSLERTHRFEGGEDRLVQLNRIVAHRIPDDRVDIACAKRRVEYKCIVASAPSQAVGAEAAVNRIEARASAE